MSPILVLLALFADPAPNAWVKLDWATIEGRRWDVPVGYDPAAKRFIILGGRTTWADYKKPRPYDVLTLESARWENTFPPDKEWGPRFGPVKAPAWKSEYWGFKDAEGNTRPNWTVYGTFSLGTKYDYDPDTRAFYFHAGQSTFKYDPAKRAWADLAPKTDPEKTLGGKLLWSSMAYSAHGKQFVLFGGGNVQTSRGDPGTWLYSSAANTWEILDLKEQPPQRANSRLVYDPVAKKVILFGGDQLDQLIADTWAFDLVEKKWEKKSPKRSPSPRAGHAMLWLPKAKKVLLLGGYGYTSATGYVEHLYRRLPLDAWLYDLGADEWTLLKHFGTGKDLPQGPTNAPLPAALDDEDNVLVHATNGTWTLRVDIKKTDDAGSVKFGVKPATTEKRTGPHDPAWYRAVPESDPAKVEAALKALPVNEWVARTTPRLPQPNMDWGSAVFSPDHDLVLRFSGGHSAYSGTAPFVYDVKTDRYSLPFVPEQPLEYVYSNDQVDGEWSFKGRPWMTGHTYKSTGYDPHSKSLVFAPHQYTYFFDPKKGEWERGQEKNRYRPNFYVVTLCTTPEGAVAWAEGKSGPGLWRLDKDRRWRSLPLKGLLPAMSADQHGMAFDSKRNRLLLFSGIGKMKGDVAQYDLATGESKWLGPTGKAKAAVPSRETVYLPHLDAVLIGARSGKHWLMYDCATNTWKGIEVTGTDPIGKGVFNNSMGLMFDPKRKLVWAVGQNSHLHVLRLDPKRLKLHSVD